jgi:two-component system response regulator
MMVENTVDILLVEDSEEDAELAIAGLKARNLGSKVVHLVDGDAALEFIFAASVAANGLAANTPRLIVLDLSLSGTDGVEILRQLKEEERTRQIPVVVMTGSANEKEMVECYRLGVNSYVSKPVDAKRYSQLVGEIAHYWLTVNRPAQSA